MTLFDLSDPLVIGFDVVGTPRTQGSVKGFLIPKTQKVVITYGTKVQQRNLKHWRGLVAAQALAWRSTRPGFQLLTGPVQARMVFRLERPKSHPKTRRTWPVAKYSGDVDKLQRAVLDALTGVLYVDDAQVLGVVASKDYGSPPGCEVRLRAVAR